MSSSSFGRIIREGLIKAFIESLGSELPKEYLKERLLSTFECVYERMKKK